MLTPKEIRSIEIAQENAIEKFSKTHWAPIMRFYSIASSIIIMAQSEKDFENKCEYIRLTNNTRGFLRWDFELGKVM